MATMLQVSSAKEQLRPKSFEESKKAIAFKYTLIALTATAVIGAALILLIVLVAKEMAKELVPSLMGLIKYTMMSQAGASGAYQIGQGAADAFGRVASGRVMESANNAMRDMLPIVADPERPDIGELTDLVATDDHPEDAQMSDEIGDFQAQLVQQQEAEYADTAS